MASPQGVWSLAVASHDHASMRLSKVRSVPAWVWLLAVLIVAPLLAPSSAAAKGGAPKVSRLSASDISRSRAKLKAVIDPQGTNTTYDVWLSYPAACSKHGCEKVNEEEVGVGTVSPGKPQTVVVAVTELPPNTKFTFWFEASNAGGETTRVHHFKTER